VVTETIAATVSFVDNLILPVERSQNHCSLIHIRRHDITRYIVFFLVISVIYRTIFLILILYTYYAARPPYATSYVQYRKCSHLSISIIQNSKHHYQVWRHYRRHRLRTCNIFWMLC